MTITVEDAFLHRVIHAAAADPAVETRMALESGATIAMPVTAANADAIAAIIARHPGRVEGGIVVHEACEPGRACLSFTGNPAGWKCEACGFSLRVSL